MLIAGIHNRGLIRRRRERIRHLAAAIPLHRALAPRLAAVPAAEAVATEVVAEAHTVEVVVTAIANED
jgi:hypothetical protein